MEREIYGCSGLLGVKIRELRRAHGLTQEQIAALAKVSVGAVRDLEQGRVSRPRPGPSRRLAEALGVNFSDLVADDRPLYPDLWVGICGPLAIKRNGIESRALPAGQRTVLGILALSAGMVVTPDSIIGVLWPEAPPVTAAGIVQTYVSRLRGMFGHSGDRMSFITRDGAGYRLHLAADRLDLFAFRQLVAQAHESADADQASMLYERAMRLWRGGPLEDVQALRDHPAVTATANERALATLEYAERAAAAGRHEMVLAHLVALTVGNPLDERLHAALMVALAGSGRQAESLRVYEDLRRRLDDELGMPPGEELREAHQRVLRQEVVSGKPKDTWRVVRQLPAVPGDFVGRQTERDALISAVSAPDRQVGVPVAVVCGQPGVGKTTLALYAAHKLSERFPDGQLWVQLAGASERPRDPGEILGEMLRDLGVPGSAIPDEHSERPRALRSALAGRKILMVADDAASVSQVEPLLPGTPGCALIVTSRMHLAGLTGARYVPLDVLPDEDALGLLARLVGADRVAADPAAALQLSDACGGLPIALRVVGSRVATRPAWPLSAMVRRLARAQTRLAEMDAGNLSVRASIASSYLMLPERHSLAFRRLALLGPSDFAGWVVAILLGEPEADEVLEDLVGRSLVASAGVDATGEPRYRLHDLLRDYAAQELAADPERDTSAAAERLLRAWLQLAMLADASLHPEPYFPRAQMSPRPSILPDGLARELAQDPIAWFTAERINLMAAVERACGSGHTELARQIASSLCSFHYLQDRYDDAELVWHRVMTHMDDSAVGVWTRLHFAASLNQRGKAAEAFPLLDACVEDAEDAGDEDPELLPFALYWRGSCAWDLDNFEFARADAERGVFLAEGAGMRLAEMLNLRRAGSALAALGKGDEAVALAERAVAVAVDLGESSYELSAVHELAHVCVRTGLHERAAQTCLRAIKLSRELGSIRNEALAYGVLGDANHGLGDYDNAIRSLLHALPILRAHHARRHIALCLLKLGYAHEALRRYPEAIGYLSQARDMFGELRLAGRAESAQQALDRCQQALSDGSGPHTLTAAYTRLGPFQPPARYHRPPPWATWAGRQK